MCSTKPALSSPQPLTRPAPHLNQGNLPLTHSLGPKHAGQTHFWAFFGFSGHPIEPFCLAQRDFATHTLTWTSTHQAEQNFIMARQNFIMARAPWCLCLAHQTPTCLLSRMSGFLASVRAAWSWHQCAVGWEHSPHLRHCPDQPHISTKALFPLTHSPGPANHTLDFCVWLTTRFQPLPPSHCV